MVYDYLNQSVLASTLCTARSSDSFFYPTTLGHTGYAFDGYMYSAGVKQSVQASWVTESLHSATRGANAAFPTQGLVLVQRASITICDASNTQLALWMIFYYGDGLGYCNNPAPNPSVPTSYTAAEVSWANGILNVLLSPDPGSFNQSPISLVINFITDEIYATTRA